jgi:hypothetical protein
VQLDTPLENFWAMVNTITTQVTGLRSQVSGHKT